MIHNSSWQLVRLDSIIDFIGMIGEIIPIVLIVIISLVVVKVLTKLTVKIVEKSKLEKSLHVFIEKVWKRSC